ncbi:MAG: methylenetetrahydrofolate reductase [NAD(P)H] [Lachnospiraceae bacterium]|nr:methylenetetrahydrofolate reductase [NAD(P)H] [Lachnospiraceae bacterium]
MKIIDIITGDRPSLSFEVFPPKTSATYESVMKAAGAIADLHPSYMSVTYGAGGGTSQYTMEIAQFLQSKGVTPLAHLSCVSSTKEDVAKKLKELKERGIENVLALRGDIPEGLDMTSLDYHYASELTREVRGAGDFCIGGACYPEVHPDSLNSVEDIQHLKEKVDAGCQFLVTQMFFDNNIFYNFLRRVREAGITVPVIPGIMPVTNAKQIKRSIALSGNSLPQRFRYIIDRYGDKPAAMKQAGIIYASEQIIDLYANGINAVHVYSMNKPDVAAALQSNLSEII